MNDLISRNIVVWRYLPDQNAKHALLKDTTTAVGHEMDAVCGVLPPECDADWHGSGSQAEHERVARLRECRDCARRLSPVSSSTT